MTLASDASYKNLGSLHPTYAVFFPHFEELWHFVEQATMGVLHAIINLPTEDIADAYYTLRVDFRKGKEWTLWNVGATSMLAINGSHKTRLVPDYVLDAWKYGTIGGHAQPIWALLDENFNVISFLTE